MVYELDLKDRKILYELDINSRQSDSEIGKKTKLSKQVVNYHIKRLVKNGIISSFFTHINLYKLGYSGHKIYIKFKALPVEKEKEMWDYLEKKLTIVYILSCSGRWDLVLGIASKNLEELEQVLSEFMNHYSSFILERAITIYNRGTMHNRKWILNKKSRETSWLLGGKIKDIKIDDLDREILKVLIKNARTPIIEIAEKLRTSSSLVIQRIKKLKQKGIIVGFRIWIPREKLGMHYCKAFIYYQNKTTEKEKKLLEYCENIPSVLGITQNIGPWDLELELEVEDYAEFHKLLKNLKNRFDIISNFETAYGEKETSKSYLPENF